ncbi:spindle assembly checkpoint MAD1-like [Octopus vulgaris]|nr:spindle assembly checkpoint MAD1-like [Octopus vulgaris]
MYCTSEPTHVFRMKRDFAAFVGSNLWDSSSNKSPRISNDLKCMLDFDQSLSENTSDPQLSLDSSAKELDTSLREAKYLKWKSDVAKYESQVQALEVKLKQSLIETTKQINLEKQEKEQCQEKADELRTQLKLLYEKEKHLQGENAEMAHKLNKMDSEIVALKKAAVASDCQKQQKILEHDQDIRSHKEKLFDVQTKLQTSQSELSEMKTQLLSTKKLLIGAQEQIVEMKAYKDGMETAYKLVKELEQKLAQYEEELILRKNLKVQLSKMGELEKELEMLKVDNTYLKNHQEMTAVLKEKLEGSQKKISRYEQRLSHYNTMECDYEVAKQQLQQWQALNDGRNTCSSLTPAVVKKTIFDLQNTEALLLEKNGKLQAIVTTQENTIGKLQNDVHQLESSVASQLAKNHQNSDQIRSWQKRCYRLSAERDGYQQIIASYDHESTIMNSDSILRTRINTLEEMLTALRQTIDMQESSLKAPTSQGGQLMIEPVPSSMLQTTAAMSNLRDVNEKIDLQLREKIADLEKKLEVALEEKNYLEMKLEERQLQGDYDPTKTKVIHMTLNPSSVDQQKRKEKISYMQSEIDRLQARVKVLEQSGGQAADVTLQVEQKLQDGCNCKEVVELRSQLETSELKNKRLLQTFKKTSQEVREATYRLMGYRLDITSANNYKLCNAYSESSDDCLLFQRGPSGELQLLETSFSKTTSKLIELYLEKQDSIPAYLSSITLDLFSRHTGNM